MKSGTKTAYWKDRVKREIVEYWLNVIYLALFFGLFTTYKRLILADYRISYFDYGVAIFQALVLGKVIMIGNALRIGRGLQDKPLIYPTLFRAFVFTVFVALFKILEFTASGLIHGKGLAGGFNELLGKGVYELLAGLLVMFLAFIPFFAIKELGLVLGEGKLAKLFFRKRVMLG